MFKNETIFHEQRFLGYHGNKFDEVVLTKDGYSFTAVNLDVDGSKVLHSHPGASFGGVLLPKTSTLEKTDKFVRYIISYAHKEKFNEIFMRLPPYIYHTLPSDELDYALLMNNFKLINNEVSLAIPINLERDRWLNELRDDTRRSIVKSIRTKHLDVRWSDDFYTFYGILEDNLGIRYDVVPAHTLQELLILKDLYPKEILLMGCYYKDKMIAGMLLFCSNTQAFETFYIAQNYEFQNFRPLNRIMYHLYDWAHAKEYKYINLGISTENEGRDVNWGLFRFKEGFGANCVLRKSYKLYL